MVLAADGSASAATCLSALRTHTSPEVPVLTVAPTTAAINEAIESSAPADVVLLSAPCRVTAGWLERLRDAARADTNTATASALSDREGPLAVTDLNGGAGDIDARASQVAQRSRKLRPRLNVAVGPCIYVRREALELVGALDPTLPVEVAVEVDFAERCLGSGLAHVAADDVIVERLLSAPSSGTGGIAVAASDVLAFALDALREPEERMWVTIDARALDGAVTGTQVHIVELIRALAQTDALRLRVLVREARIDRETLGLLRGLPDTEVLDEDQLGEETPRSALVHRPQQAFAAEDVAIAMQLGERLVISQLDLIAYRNPAYFPDAGAWRDYRRASRHGIVASERVVVFSEHTRGELLSEGLAEGERISIVAPGLDHARAPEPRPPSTHAHAPGPFLLCLGTDFLHKNRIFALRLLEDLRERHGWTGSLVLAGTHIPNGSSREAELSFLRARAQLEDLVRDLGAVSEEEKAWLMAHASAVVYPSVYEGFGLVPFEAALAGVPCIFAAQSSLAEIAPPGTATILPWDPLASAESAHRLLTDPEARTRHVESLAAVARKLTWAAAADAMVDVYRQAAAGPPRAAARLARDAAEREGELLARHRADVERLIGERELVLRDYYELIDQLGPGRGLVGDEGSLPTEVQHALLALSARPALARPLYATGARLFAAARALRRGPRRLFTSEGRKPN